MKILIDGQTLSTYEIKRGIGRVFIALINQLVPDQDQIDWYITLKDKQALSYFHPAVAAKLTAVELTLPAGLDPLQHSDEYSNCLQQIISQYRIDTYWNINPLMLNVFYPSKLLNVNIHVMIHDLIPQVMADVYQARWSVIQKQEYQRRLATITTHAQHIVAISKCTHDDLINYCPSAAQKCSIIYHGMNHFIFYPRAIKIPLYSKPYLFYVGGFDPRKNMFAALEAFAHLCQKLDTNPLLQFYIVCDFNPEQARQFYQAAERLGVLTRVKLCGQLVDAELSELYANAELFFFPSRYEGFGLPVLEAIASGILTVASDIAAIHEVGQDALIYCHSDNTEQMAQQLHYALNLPSEQKQQLINHGQQLAQSFTWEKAAHAYLQTLQSQSRHQPKARLNIALVTPWPPAKSGIATYAYRLVQHLSQYCDITIFSNQIEHQPIATTPSQIRQTEVRHNSLTQLKQHKDEFDLIVYQLGNNAEHHRDIYKLAWQYPGIVILHDYYIYEFMQQAFANDQDRTLYEAALVISRQHHPESIMADSVQPLPMSEAIVNQSKAVVVHNAWTRQQLSDFQQVHVIPHGAELDYPPLSLEQRQQIANEFKIDNEYVIGVFGFMNYTKRFHAILQAVNQLHQKNYPVKLLVVGKLEGANAKLDALYNRWKIPPDLIRVTNYVDDQRFIDLMAFCDIYVGLRKPSMGETSGPLMLALGMGKPCIVSDFQQFAQLPDDICLKVLTDEREIPHLTACIESLLRQPQLRQQLAHNAKHYISKNAVYSITAQRFYQLFNQIAAETADQRVAAQLVPVVADEGVMT